MYYEHVPFHYRRAETEVEGTFCPRCGSYLQVNHHYEYMALHCPKCGYDFQNYPSSSDRDSEM